VKGGLDDPRLQQGGDHAMDAENLEQLGQLADARERYARASELYAAVALDDDTLPKVRVVIAESAVALAARGGRFDRAVAYAERFLAEPGRLTPAGIEELEKLLASYRRLIPKRSVEPPVPTPSRALFRWRDEMRERYYGKAA
jgi:hypothetical protein